MPSEINEEIHNRSESRVASTAGDDCVRVKDHGQRLGPAWSADQDQWLQAASAKPQDTRIS